MAGDPSVQHQLAHAPRLLSRDVHACHKTTGTALVRRTQRYWDPPSPRLGLPSRRKLPTPGLPVSQTPRQPRRPATRTQRLV